MTDSERQEMLTEARVFYLASPLLLPMIEKRKKITISRLTLKHRDGDNRFDTLVAELSVLEDLERELNQKSQIYQTLEEKSK